jgi:hypothetical protein
MTTEPSGVPVTPYLPDPLADRRTPVAGQHRVAATAPRIPVPTRQESTR